MGVVVEIPFPPAGPANTMINLDSCGRRDLGDGVGARANKRAGLRPEIAMPRGCFDAVGRDDVPVRTAHLDGHRAAAVDMPQGDASAVGPRPAVAPLHQGEQRREQLFTLVGEVIVLAASLSGHVIGPPPGSRNSSKR